MPEEYRNIHKTARKTRGYTQESAAERLNISISSLQAYETGARIPSNDVVELMVICYDNQALAYQHLRESSALMNRVVPKLEPRSVLEIAVRIHNRIKELENKGGLDRLMAIAENNVIDDDERPEFYAIVAEVREIVRSGLELDVYCASDFMPV